MLDLLGLPPERHWYVSCLDWTVRVTTIDGRITFAAPIVRRFLGRNIGALLAWAQDEGTAGDGLEVIEIGDES